MKHRALLVCSLLVLFGLPASAASFKIDFNGTFSDLCSGDCTTPPANQLTALNGTVFSGEFIFPDSGIDTLPGDPIRGVYEFGSGEAIFRIDSTVDSFNVTLMNVQVFVRDCDSGVFCELNTDSVWLSAVSSEFRFDLALNTTGGSRTDWDQTFSGDEIPALDAFEILVGPPRPPALEGELNPLFSISTVDFSAVVDSFSDPGESLMQASVSTVPVPPALALFLSALGVCAAVRRCGAGRA